MFIYKKYVIGNIVPIIILTIFVLSGFAWITQIVKFFYLIDRGFAIIDFLKLVSLFIPLIIFMIMPIATLISIIYVYTKLKNNFQILVLQQSGLSDLSIVKPALFFASLISIICCLISFYLLPYSYKIQKSQLNFIRNNYINSFIEAKTFNKISKHITMYVDKKISQSQFYGIIVFDSYKPEEKRVIIAKYCSIELKNNLPLLKLHDGFSQLQNDKGKIINTHFQEMKINGNINRNSENKATFSNSLELFIHQMLHPNQEILNVKKRSTILVDMSHRIIWPLFSYALTFLGLSILITQHYDKNELKSKSFVLIPPLLFTISHFIIQKLSYKNSVLIIYLYLNFILCILVANLIIRHKKLPGYV